MSESIPKSGGWYVPTWVIAAVFVFVLGQGSFAVGALWKVALAFNTMQNNVAANTERSKGALSTTQFGDLMISRDEKVGAIKETQKQLSARIRNIEIRMAQLDGKEGTDAVYRGPYRPGYVPPAPLLVYRTVGPTMVWN